MSFVDDALAVMAQRPAGVEKTWGLVTVASPLQVKLAGDTAATRVELKATTYTPVVGHKVALARIGAQWVVEYQIGAA